MASTLKILSGPTALTTSAVTQYTGPAATAVIREIHACNESGSAATFTLSIGTDGAGKRFFYQQSVAARDSFDWTGNIPVDVGLVIQALASAGTSITLTVTGVEL